MYALVFVAQMKSAHKCIRIALDVVIETYSFFYGHDDRQIEAGSAAQKTAHTHTHR